jgi:hypothetical protein
VAVPHRMGFVVLLVTCLLCCGSAEAGQIKYTYLKVGQGDNAQAYAFTSKQACEAARRQHDANWNQMIRVMKKRGGTLGTFAPPPRTRCMDTLPFGFVRP